MPASERSICPALSCFVLTEIRTIDAEAHSTLIDSISGNELTASMTQPPQPGTRVQFNLGDQGWVDGVVKWTGGKQLGVTLQREIDRAALLGA
jgi:hypothetical protein